MKSEFIDVSPAIAESWLKRNKNNRDFREQHIKLLTTQMREGKWQCNGESIKFAVGGDLLDGQHRLTAIVRSRTTQRLLIVSGLSKNSFATIDVGKKRTSADAMQVSHIPEYKRVSVALPYVMGYDRRLLSEFRIQMTPATALEHLERDYSDLPKALTEIGSKRCAVIPRHVFDALYYIFRRSDKVLAQEYMAALRTGEGIESCNAWRILRERLIKEATKAHGVARLSDKYLGALVVKGWNHARGGTDAQRISWKPEVEDFPEAL